MQILAGKTHESSRVRSNHWTLAVIMAFCWMTIRWRASEQTRSDRIGLRLYAMAEEPIWSFSNGSSTSLRLARRRMSVAILWAVAPNEASGPRTSMSILRE